MTLEQLIRYVNYEQLSIGGAFRSKDGKVNHVTLFEGDEFGLVESEVWKDIKDLPVIRVGAGVCVLEIDLYTGRE